MYDVSVRHVQSPASKTEPRMYTYMYKLSNMYITKTLFLIKSAQYTHIYTYAHTHSMRCVTSVQVMYNHLQVKQSQERTHIHCDDMYGTCTIISERSPAV